MDAAEARLLVTTAVASAYADFVGLSAEHEAAVSALRNRLVSADLVAKQLAAGVANRGEANVGNCIQGLPLLRRSRSGCRALVWP